VGRRAKSETSKRAELTPLELRVMQVLWERGDATAAEIRQALVVQPPLAGTTVHTVLANLRKKGYLAPIPTIERALRFRPRVSREQVARSSLTHLLGNFFGGSPHRLMAHLIREEELDEEELGEIRKLLRAHGSVKGKTS